MNENKVIKILNELTPFNKITDHNSNNEFETRGFKFVSRGYDVHTYINPIKSDEIVIYIAKTNATNEEDVVLNRTFTRDSILKIIVLLSALIGDDIELLTGE